jgi:uncharacterized protein YabE (DUF348 family)
LLTIHDGEQNRGILTRDTTLRQALKDAKVSIDPNDMVEPGLDETLVANGYDVNIYRARPITIVDGAIRTKVMSPYQTPKQITEHAGITLHDEDVTTTDANTDMVSEGAGVRLTINRATSFTLMLYGTKTTAYTREKTVAAMLKSKKVILGPDDTLSVPAATKLQAGMTVELWRNGKQTATEERDVAFDTEKIQDVDQAVGYKKITTPGIVGKKTVTYEIEMKNGQEVSRKEIQSVVTKTPSKQVEVVGAKPSFSGDFAAALAKLRSCEGGYGSWNPAGYYGAYQFDRQTWSTVADSASYGNASPAEQDQAARNLYVRRGWSPWPNCGRGLPDTYR